jgi:hypothetical protein
MNTARGMFDLHYPCHYAQAEGCDQPFKLPVRFLANYMGKTGPAESYVTD